MSPQKILEPLDTRALAPTYARPDRVFVAGRGCTLFDQQGQPFLDMTSGVAVNALGHGSPVIAEALRRAADGLIHTSNLFHTEPAARLARALAERSFADRVFFCNSGAESVEAALKFAILRRAPRQNLLAFDGSFHGRTLGALSVTDKADHHAMFGAPPRRFARYNEPAALDAIDDDTCAVIVEPIQGEGGVRAADPDWLTALRRRCDDTGTLLIFDEVQVGLGRTGRLWAHEWSGVTPDLMTIAKPLAGGLPMGAVLMTDNVAAAIRPGHHATTFGGGPLIASVALAVLEHIAAPEFLAGVRARAESLRAAIAALDSPAIAEVRGRGLLLGLRLAATIERPAAAVVNAALEEGLLIVAARDDVVRLIPPLNARREELEAAVSLLGRALERAKLSP